MALKMTLMEKLLVVKLTIFTFTLWGQLMTCGAIHTRKSLLLLYFEKIVIRMMSKLSLRTQANVKLIKLKFVFY